MLIFSIRHTSNNPTWYDWKHTSKHLKGRICSLSFSSFFAHCWSQCPTCTRAPGALRSSGLKSLRDGWHHQNGWKNGKIPNGRWPPPPHFRKIILRISRQKCVCSLWRDCCVLYDPISHEIHVVQQFNMVIGFGTFPKIHPFWRHRLSLSLSY